MKFRTLLVIGIGALVIVTLFCGVMAAMTLHVTTKSRGEVTNRVVFDLEALHAVRLDAEQLVAAGRGLSTHRRRSRIGASSRRWQIRSRSFPQRPARVANRSRTRARESRSSSKRRSSTRMLLVPAVVLHRSLREPDLTPYRAKLESAMDDLTDREQDDLADASIQAGRVVRAVGITTLVGCLIGVAIGIVLAVVRLAPPLAVSSSASRPAAYSRKELLGIVSHDLRSPLNSIMLGLDIVKEGKITDRTVSVIAHSARAHAAARQ